VVTASAINAALAKGGVGNRNELWSSESELDFSDQEIDMSRSELRLVVTVYAPALAETASATVPTLVVSQLLGAPLEHLEEGVLAKGLATLMKYADIRVRDDDKTAALVVAESAANGTNGTKGSGGGSGRARDVDERRQAQEREKLREMLTREQSSREHTREHTASTASSTGTDEYGMPQALEPRLTFAIDPQLPPREKKPFEAEAGKVKISASPGMPTVSTVGVQIFHRAMRIHADTDTEDIPHHYLLMRIFSGVGSRGRSYRLEAYNPKLSHSAQVTMSEPRFTRLIAGRSDMLLPGSERADFLAMVIQEAIIVKNAVILAHMRLIVRKDGTTRVAREIKRREHEELARIETKSYRFGLRVRGILYLAKAHVHRLGEETRDENTNARIQGESTGGLEIELTSKFVAGTLQKQKVVFGVDKVRDVFKKEDGANAVKALSGNVGNARMVLRNQLTALVGNVPRPKD
jgi:hypothetical protein